MPRLIDADELEKDYRNQFESVYKHIRDSVNPSDFFVERHAAYNKELMRLEMEAFCKYLQSRPTIDAEPVRHGRWIRCKGKSNLWYCSECGEKILYNPNKRTYNVIKKPVHEVNKRCRSCGAKMDGGASDG